ncbi:MAG: hypothetical protein HY236_17680 [Acidobacteria bacterium]|nr:hypothetical protein [Acidobacteriota bacterium]
MTGLAEGLKQLIGALDRLHIGYMVGGSLASSIHGVARATRDIDLVADIKKEHIAPLAAALGPEFYADPEMMEQALLTGRPFNLIHYASSYKFDVFPLPREPYYQVEFARRRTAEYSLEGQVALKFYVVSPEDAVLTKLVWYRSGKEVSEQQWSDVLDVVRVKGELLDLTYLRQWAGPLGVAELLEKALEGR